VSGGDLHLSQSAGGDFANSRVLPADDFEDIEGRRTMPAGELAAAMAAAQIRHRSTTEVPKPTWVPGRRRSSNTKVVLGSRSTSATSDFLESQTDRDATVYMGLPDLPPDAPDPSQLSHTQMVGERLAWDVFWSGWSDFFLGGATSLSFRDRAGMIFGLIASSRCCGWRFLQQHQAIFVRRVLTGKRATDPDPIVTRIRFLRLVSLLTGRPGVLISKGVAEELGVLLRAPWFFCSLGHETAKMLLSDDSSRYLVRFGDSRGSSDADFFVDVCLAGQFVERRLDQSSSCAELHLVADDSLIPPITVVARDGSRGPSILDLSSAFVGVSQPPLAPATRLPYFHAGLGSVEAAELLADCIPASYLLRLSSREPDAAVITRRGPAPSDITHHLVVPGAAAGTFRFQEESAHTACGDCPSISALIKAAGSARYGNPVLVPADEVSELVAGGQTTDARPSAAHGDARLQDFVQFTLRSRGSVLGQGSYATVHECLLDAPPTVTRAVFAVKFLADGGKKDDLIEEMKLLHKLSHPNIIATTGFVIDPDTQQFGCVMERCRGTLETLIAERVADVQRGLLVWFEMAEVLAVMNQLCNALHFMHGTIPPTAQ
jgi:Protein kinase domain